MMGYKNTIGSSLVVLLLSCGPAMQNSHSPRGRGHSAPPPLEIAQRNFDVDFLPGVWKIDCTVDPLWLDVAVDVSRKPHQRHLMTLDPSGQFMIEARFYTGSDCDEATLYHSLVIGGQYLHLLKKGIELRPQSVRAAFHSEGAVAEASKTNAGRGVCMRSSWEIGVFQECPNQEPRQLGIRHLSRESLILERFYLDGGTWKIKEDHLSRVDSTGKADLQR